MNIYLLRHGKAEDAGDKPDDQRKLTDEGAELIKKSLPGIKERVGTLDYMFTSPMLRAVETAFIVADYFKCRNFLEGTDLLARPDCDAPMLKKINALIGKENIMCVGHIPLLVDFARFMIPEGDETPIEIKKGGLVRLQFKGFILPHTGRLKWIATPKELRGEV